MSMHDMMEAARLMRPEEVLELLLEREETQRTLDASWNAAIEAAANIANRAKRDAYVLRGDSAGGAYHRADEALRIAGNIAEEIRALKREAK